MIVHESLDDLEFFSESQHCFLYKKEGSGRSGTNIIKLLKEENPAQQQLVHLNNEYEIGRHLEGAGGRRVFGKVRIDHRIGLDMEFVEGETLKAYLKRYQVGLDQKLSLAIQLCTRLEEIHGKNVIHKDFHSNNIIYNRESDLAVVIDLGISSLLGLKTREAANPDHLEGRLPYISPEQTGRVNLVVDFRSDLYSLGVVLYELFTGSLPFISDDPLEVIHSHLARKPQPLHMLDKALPPMLDRIVGKLLEKTPEQRYQSAAGVRRDLQLVLEQFQKTGKVDSFTVGCHDRSKRFHIPRKLYGREREQEILLSAFTRTVRNDSLELLMVTGYSGIGKSSLVTEIRKSVTEARGLFLSGKYDQLQKDIPYSAIVGSFSVLVDHLLGLSEENLAKRRDTIRKALGINGQIILDVLPEMALIIGPQPEVQRLGPTESQNRFNRVFQSFIHCFCNREQPLVLFLDDMQWADPASLKLLELIAGGDEISNILIIGAYRDNEVSEVHPLILSLDKMRKRGKEIHEIVLKPLQQTHVTELVANVLGKQSETVGDLARLVYRKTGGNPFFVEQFLLLLHTKGLLFFNQEQGDSAGGWDWNLEEIRKLDITENVVDLLLGIFAQLPVNEQSALSFAACLGNRFSLKNLALVTGRSPVETYQDVYAAMQSGLLQPTSRPEPSTDDFATASIIYTSFCFNHDRIQQAAYALIPKDEVSQTHLSIGRTLRNAGKDIDGMVFEIADHLNFGHELVNDQGERVDFAEINLLAAHKAKDALAYGPALSYCRSGRKLLSDRAWQDNHRLMFDLSILTLECEFLNSNQNEAHTLAGEMLGKAEELLDKVKVYEILILFHITRNQMNEAIDTGLKALALLGFALPSAETEIVDMVEEIRRGLPASPDRISALGALVEMDNEEALAAVRILTTTSSAAYIANPTIWPLIILKTVKLCVEYGNSPLAASAYSWFGALLCGPFNDIPAGYEYGRLALKVLEKHNSPMLVPKVNNMFNVFVRAWKEHVLESAESLDDAIRTGLEMGDVEYAFYAAAHQGAYMMMGGSDLAEIEPVMESYLALTVKHKFEFHETFIRIFLQTHHNLAGNSEELSRLSGTVFDEEKTLPALIENKIVFLVLCAYGVKTMLLYLDGNYREAVEAGRDGGEFKAGAAGTLYYAEHNFYYSLSLLADCESGKVPEQVVVNQQDMQVWADQAPMNFQHKYDLVEAEIYRVQGSVERAIESFERALAGAGESGFINMEALVHRCYARFWRELGSERYVKLHIRESVRLYDKWGAKGVSGRLLELTPWLAREKSKNESPGAEKFTRAHTQTSFTSSGSGELALASFMKMSQALSSEMNINLLCPKLLDLVIENGGAESGCLILKRENRLTVEARGSVTMDPQMLYGIDLEAADFLSPEVVQFVSRTGKDVILDDCSVQDHFSQCRYLKEKKTKSVLCMPLVYGERMSGILYLENNQIIGAFSSERCEILRLLSSQMAIALENALLYQLESKRAEELLEANQKLRQSEENLAITLNSIGDAVIATDHSCRVTMMNPVAEKLIGRDLASARGQHLQEVLQLIDAENRKPRGNPAERVIRHGCMVSLEDNTILVGADGIERYVADSGAPIFAADNLIVGTVLVFRDITRDRELEEQLRHSEKMEAIGQLAGGVAHDFNNMLAGISGASELLELSCSEIPVAANYIDIIKTATERASGLTQKLLDFSRKGKKVSRPVDMHSIISDTIAILERSIDKAITITTDLQAVNPTVTGDPSQLQNGLLNICVNARDAIKGAGTIHIATLNTELDETYCSLMNKLTPGEYIRVSISDTGIGIPQEIQAQIFEPFYTTKTVGSGTGLGLAAVYGMVKDHKGDITLYSEVGTGSVFHAYLPVSEETSTDHKKASEKVIMGSGVILLIDDEEVIRVTGAHLLESLGYTVLLAENGEIGVNIYKRNMDSIDLVILDMVMPVMGGKEAFSAIRSMNREAKIIVSSGFARGANLTDIMLSGLSGFILKPFQRSTLSILIAEVLGIQEK